MKLCEAGHMNGKFDPAGVKLTSRINSNLIKAISKAATKQHIYIFAPSGFGKSASALRWLKGVQDAKAWITLTENDDFPNAFFKQLAMAFLSVPPDNASLIAKLREEDFDNFHHLVIRTAFYLTELTSNTYVVLDSFECITNDTLIRDLVGIMRTLNPGYTLIIIDRHEPHGLFSDLILRNMMSVIKDDEIVI